MFTVGMRCVRTQFFLNGVLLLLFLILTFANTLVAFDRPFSANAWQYYIQHFLNSKLPFVMFYLTTFVICATDIEDAECKSIELLDEMEDRGWRITLPRVQDWKSSIDELRLDALYTGIRPA